LRKSLGDDLRLPRYLQSVPKVGYQLTGVVEEIPAPSPPSPPPSRNIFFYTSYKPALAIGLVVVAALVLVGVYLAMSKRTPPPPWHWQEIAWWKLDEGSGAEIHDSTKHHLDGALSGGVSWPSSRRDGLRFTGLDALALGRQRGVLPSGSHPRTFSAWIKPDVPIVDTGMVFGYGVFQRSPNRAYMSFGLDNTGRPGFGFAMPGSTLSATHPLDNAWHMLTVTYAGPPSNAARIFVDGHLDQSGAFASTPDTAADSVWRMGYPLAGDTPFRGNIKDVRVFDRALNETQVQGLYGCSSGIADLDGYYYLPVMLAGLIHEGRAPGDVSTPIRNGNLDFSGVQLALAKDACAMTSVEGANVGQDLRISLEALVPTDAAGNLTQAGPYFRSRLAGAGDGLMGGRSAGFWVQLQSNGMIKIRRLNPLAVVAFTSPRPGFDPGVFHKLAMEARGATLQVWLDGQLVEFDQSGVRVNRVAIPAVWEAPQQIGDDEGAAGVAFGAEGNRGKIGGQRVRNLTVKRLY